MSEYKISLSSLKKHIGRQISLIAGEITIGHITMLDEDTLMIDLN